MIILRYAYLQPSIIAQSQMLADPTGLINNFQPPNLLNKTGGRILRTTTSRGAGGLHRSAYYSVGKGINAAKKQAVSEVIVQV